MAKGEILRPDLSWLNSKIAEVSANFHLPSFLGKSSTSEIVQSKDKLLFVTAIWRHGQRNPVEFFDGDVNDASSFPRGVGEMTLKGWEQLFQLGQKLRNRYMKDIKLLSTSYSSNQIYIESTDVNRTLISAQCVAQGLYSGGSRAGIDYPKNPNWPMNFVPIPIHADPYREDDQLPYYYSCPRKDELWKMVETSKAMERIRNLSDFLVNKINQNLKQNLTLKKAMKVMGAINAERLQNRPIVAWAKDLIDDIAYFLASHTGVLMGFGPEDTSNPLGINLQRELGILLTGGFLNEIVGRFVQRANCELDNPIDPFCSKAKNRKFHGYSAHDTTLLTIFRGLGFDKTNGDEQIIPGYGSCFMMELWQQEDFDPTSKSSLNKHYLKLLYLKNSSTGEIIDLSYNLPICLQGKCFLDVLAVRAADLAPKPEMRKLCTIPVSTGHSNHNFLFVLLILIIFLIG